ncbi:unannotated protein [freshwater metagenome]|uniref:Unannotated protein n=1 Tax=freshwater metagenome TaxID=449393 RepID=A0A6J7JEW5_9ZZZZ
METTTTALSTADWLVRFMLLPAAVIAVIWFLWALPQWLRRSSFRPGEPWVGEPLWVGAPRELAAAGRVAIAGSGELSLSDTPDDRGGASARW